MESTQLIIFLYLFVLIFLSFVNFRRALLFFFASKFTIDIFWDYPIADGLNVLKITGFLFPLFCFIYFLFKRPPISKHPYWNILIVLFVLNLVASLWGIFNYRFEFFPIPHSPLTVRHILDWNLRFLNLMAVILIVPYIVNNLRDRIIFFRVFLISTTVPFVLSWYQFSFRSIHSMMTRTTEPYSVSLFQRLNAAYHDSGTLAIVMFTAIIISILLGLIELSKPLRIIYFIYSVLCGIILYFTFSRTLWISLTVFLILFFLLQKKYIYLTAVVLTSVIIFATIPLTQKRFENELNWIENNHAGSNYDDIEKLGTGRIWLWNDAKKHYFKLDWISKIIGSGGSFGSHNQYIAWLLRNGIIGLAVWLLFLYKLGYFLTNKFRRDPKDTAGLFASVLFFVVTGISNLFMQPWDNMTFTYFFWGTIGFTIFQNNPSSASS